MLHNPQNLLLTLGVIEGVFSLSADFPARHHFRVILGQQEAISSTECEGSLANSMPSASTMAPYSNEIFQFQFLFGFFRA